jgi:hypothetical protein
MPQFFVLLDMSPIQLSPPAQHVLCNLYEGGEDMKKEILVVFLSIGFFFAGPVSANAGNVTWTIVEDASFAGQSPGADGRLCTSDDGATNCNMDPVANCATSGSPTKGSCSYAELTFKMASSCFLGNTGQSCTTNSDCGSHLHPCIPCSPNPGYSYFGLNASGGTKGAGNYTALHCDNQFDVTKVAIGTSEVVSQLGGGCMTLDTFNSSSGCSVGSVSMNYDADLWMTMGDPCDYALGTMPGLNLSGRIMATTSTAAACGYTTTQLNSIVSTAGLGAGDYLAVLCGSGTLPTDLESVCIPGADWEVKILASVICDVSSASNLSSASDDICLGCSFPCPEWCMGAAAEGIE